MIIVDKNKLVTVEIYWKDQARSIRVETPLTLTALPAEEQKGYTKLTMKMRPMDWGIFNRLQSESLNPRAPGVEDSVNWILYKQKKFKALLAEWDAKDDKGAPIPVKDETLDSLHPIIPEIALREYDSKTVFGAE